MKALAILGTSSGAGQSWTTIALCAWLRRQDVDVAPLKGEALFGNLTYPCCSDTELTLASTQVIRKRLWQAF